LNSPLYKFLVLISRLKPKTKNTEKPQFLGAGKRFFSKFPDFTVPENTKDRLLWDYV
jgi:hypothetical protein